MTLPLLALSDDEAMHYAAFDAGAAAECARRSIAGHGSYLHAMDRLQRRVAYLESELEDAEDSASEVDDLEAGIRNALEELAKADAHMSAGQLFDLIEEARRLLEETGHG